MQGIFNLFNQLLHPAFFGQDQIKALLIKTITVFIILFIFLRLVFSFYNRLIYPIRQFFKKKNEFGYVVNENGNFEHREFVEKLIKRPLTPGEEVHHINGVRCNNRKSNLALMTKENHQRWHKKLEWMWERKMKTPIEWQRRQLKDEFEATLF